MPIAKGKSLQKISSTFLKILLLFWKSLNNFQEILLFFSENPKNPVHF